MHPLSAYLEERNIAAQDFADAIGVRVQSVYRYMTGERIPEPAVMARIKAETGGALNADHFYAAVAAE